MPQAPVFLNVLPPTNFLNLLVTGQQMYHKWLLTIQTFYMLTAWVYVLSASSGNQAFKKCNFSAVHTVLQKVLNYGVITSIKMRSHRYRHTAITSQSQLTCHNQVPWSKMRLDRSSSRVMLFFERTSMKETTPVKTVARARILCKKMSTTTRPCVWLYMIKADRGRKTVCHTMEPRAVHSFSLPLYAHCHYCFFKIER